MEVDNDIEKSHSFVIRATNVPLQFFENRDLAKKYFRRFGKVKLVMFKPKRRALCIEYANEDSMLNALEVAGEYNGFVFNVTRDTETVVKKKKVRKNPDPDWDKDPEVRAELEAMGAFGPKRTYDLRPEAMAVDSTEGPQVAKVKQRKWKGASGSPKATKKSIGSKETLGSEQADLCNIIRQQAVTVEDKFKVLDARDKLIRLNLKKNVELSKTSATVGTCPDMCPEKERLMRETQHQVALYEQEDGGKGMNARLAVKQYSRSSADQEAPLPQELRPVSVLQMTMGYLMHKIMGLCNTPDVNLAEWYHFLWDRTRGIRKDITQQELCCQGSVELVEQCARFHIFCSARLVAEDPSVFDQKINTENLTKCLQTLKYMYHDLQFKGETCGNEPEFRAYIILLNLNDGNFMWEVQQLKPDIQQSKEVQFALDVYSSLDKRNYVKFFKLVNSTTFLNACILMRYFIQVRVSAVKTLLKSYSPRISQSSLPVSYLTKILAFESSRSTIEFFESYGLFTDLERSRIVLDRPSFSDPEYPYILDRAINLVESKQTVSIGEAICGKELPPRLYEIHVPQNSFTEDGYLKLTEDIDVMDGLKKEESKEQVDDPRISDSPSTRQTHSPDLLTNSNIFAPKPSTSNTVRHRQSESIFSKNERSSPNIFASKPTESPNIFAPRTSEHIFGVKRSQSPNIFAPKSDEPNMSTYKPGEHSIFRQIPQINKNETPKLLFTGTTIPGDVFVPKEKTPPPKAIEKSEPSHDQKIEELKKRHQEEQVKLRKRIEEEKRKAELEKQRLFERQKALEAQKAAAIKKKIIEEENRRKIEEEERRSLEIKLAVKNTIEVLLRHTEESIKQEKLKEISKRIHDRKLMNVVAKWKENMKRNRKRKAIDFSPLWGGSKTLEEEAEELKMYSQDLTLFNIKRYKRGQPFEIPVSEDFKINKIDLCDLTYKLLVKKFLELDMKLHQELFWKVTISIPNALEFGCGLNHMEKVLDGSIQWKEKNSTTVLIEQSKSSPTVTYCLEKQKGFVVNSRNDTNGFIFIAKDFNDDLSKRILLNFKNYGVFVKVPVVFVLQHYDKNKSNLKSLIEEGIISEYLILVDKFTSKNLSNVVEEALVFLSTRVEKAPPLEMDTLKSFLLKYLCSDVWKRAKSFAKWNSNYKNCLKNPNTVIYLYNEALDRLKRIAVDETCREYAKFPEIFKSFLRSEIPDALPCDYKYIPSFSDNSTYIRHIEKILNGLTLPNFLENWPPNNQLQLELSISKYSTRVFKESQAIFYRVMSILLRNIDPEVNFKDIKDVVWTDVIEVLATEKLNQANFSLYGTGFVNKSVYNQLIVVYDVNALHNHNKCDWFYINNPVIKHKILQMLEEEKRENIVVEEEISGIVVEEEKFDDLDLDRILAKLQQPRKQNVNQIKTELNDCRKMLDDLEETFAIHKKILEKSGDFLTSVVEEKNIVKS